MGALKLWLLFTTLVFFIQWFVKFFGLKSFQVLALYQGECYFLKAENHQKSRIIFMGLFNESE